MLHINHCTLLLGSRFSIVWRVQAVVPPSPASAVPCKLRLHPYPEATVLGEVALHRTGEDSILFLSLVLARPGRGCSSTLAQEK